MKILNTCICIYVCLYFREELKVIKYEFRKASCGGDVMRKRTHARWFDYGARTGHDIRPWRGMTKNVRVIYWCVFLYCCLQHINETTIFFISILLWLHFLMIYVNVYISVLILNKVFFFDCRMSNDLWYSVINGTLRNWIWDGWQNRRDKVLSHLVTDHMF